MFCDACGRNSSFAVMNRTRTFNIKGMDIQVPYRTEICINCGEERYNDELEMSIMEKAITMYRDSRRCSPLSKSWATCGGTRFPQRKWPNALVAPWGISCGRKKAVWSMWKRTGS